MPVEAQKQETHSDKGDSLPIGARKQETPSDEGDSLTIGACKQETPSDTGDSSTVESLKQITLDKYRRSGAPLWLAGSSAPPAPAQTTPVSSAIVPLGSYHDGVPFASGAVSVDSSPDDRLREPDATRPRLVRQAAYETLPAPAAKLATGSAAPSQPTQVSTPALVHHTQAPTSSSIRRSSTARGAEPRPMSAWERILWRQREGVIDSDDERLTTRPVP